MTVESFYTGAYPLDLQAWNIGLANIVIHVILKKGEMSFWYNHATKYMGKDFKKHQLFAYLISYRNMDDVMDTFLCVISLKHLPFPVSFSQEVDVYTPTSPEQWSDLQTGWDSITKITQQLSHRTRPVPWWCHWDCLVTSQTLWSMTSKTRVPWASEKRW